MPAAKRAPSANSAQPKRKEQRPPEKRKNSGKLTTADGKKTRYAKSLENKALNAKVVAEERAARKVPPRKKGAIAAAKKNADNPLLIPGTEQWNEPLVQEIICELVGSCTHSTKVVLREGYTDENGVTWPLPDERTVNRWRYRSESFAASFMRAKAAQSALYVDESLEIADNARNDFMEREVSEGNFVPVADHEHIKRTAMRLDIRKWVAERLHRNYGAKVEMTASVTNFTKPDLSQLSPEDLAAAVALAEKMQNGQS